MLNDPRCTYIVTWLATAEGFEKTRLACACSAVGTRGTRMWVAADLTPPSSEPTWCSSSSTVTASDPRNTATPMPNSPAFTTDVPRLSVRTRPGATVTPCSAAGWPKPPEEYVVTLTTAAVAEGLNKTRWALSPTLVERPEANHWVTPWATHGVSPVPLASDSTARTPPPSTSAATPKDVPDCSRAGFTTACP